VPAVAAVAAAAADEAGWEGPAPVVRAANAFALPADSQPLMFPVHHACRANARSAVPPWRGNSQLAPEGSQDQRSVHYMELS